MDAIRRRNADWEHEEILQLIELLKNKPEIWDPDHESYHHHQRRKLILKSIAKTLRKNTRTVEMKLKSLRTSYTRMHSKIQDEIKRHGSFNGHVWFGYEPMNFLSKILEKRTEKEGTRRVELQDEGNQVECSGDESEDEFPARKIYNASWKYSQLLELIDLYKEHSLLWDTNHVNYHHKHMKIHAIKSIAEKLQKTGPEVKTKIKSLKTIFLRIDKKVKDDIQKNGKITCKLWFGYKRMSFLDPECSKICEMYLSTPNCDIETSKETNNNSDEDDDDEEEEETNNRNFSWTLETTVELMQMYKNHPQIWDPEHDGSNNRLIRNEVINLFAKTFDTNKYEIEKKLKTLRSQFLRQHKVVVSSAKDGNKKPSKLWFGYKYMSFLAKIYDDECDDDQEENTIEIKQELTMDSDTSVMSEDTSSQQSHKGRKRKCNDNSDHDPLLEMKINKKEHVRLNTESGHNCSASDEYTAFGQFVAQELKKIKDEYALMMAKNEISSLIFKAQMHQANKK